MTLTDTHRAIDAVWRIESSRIIAGLVRMLRDIDLAEEFAQDALLAALEHWPKSGVPDNPGAWLMTAARRRAIDRLRHNKLLQRKHVQLAGDLEDAQEEAVAAADARLDDVIGDDLLRLMFIACHPVLTVEARTALTLRLLGGLATDEIARAFLVSEATMAQRIVRAKKTLSRSEAAFEAPHGDELGERLGAVLGVVYLIFNEGYAATSGDDWIRPRLCEEALRLGRIITGLMPHESETHGLVALMELQASRASARIDGATGEPVLLLQQDRTRWDQLLIQRGLAALRQAETLGGTRKPYALQAAIAACHARAVTAEATEWPRIATLYDTLAEVAPSPVVQLNRAVALGMAFGPDAGLALVDTLMDEPALQDYYPLPVVRGDLLERLGRLDEAHVQFKRAAQMAGNTRVRAQLLQRAAACDPAMKEQ